MRKIDKKILVESVEIDSKKCFFGKTISERYDLKILKIFQKWKCSIMCSDALILGVNAGLEGF